MIQSEQRFQTIIDAAPLGIAIANQEGYFLEVNKTFTEMLGYSAAELITMRIDDLHAQAELRRVLRELKEMAPGEKRLSQNIPCLRKDGSRIFVNIYSAQVVINDMRCIVSFLQEITERLKAEKALRESEEKYRSILASIEEGYFEVDLAGNMKFVNEATCAIMGYSAQELMGMNNRDYTKPETAKQMYAVFNTVFRTGKPAKIANFEIIAKDGTTKILELSAALMHDSENTPNGFRGIVRDVTERLWAEKDKERLASQIQQAQKMEAIGTLAGGIAHDFNNLLMGFQGNISLMLLDLAPDHPHSTYLKNMESYVIRGSELTRQILGFARRGKYQVKTTNLNDLLDKSADMFSRTKREISIHKKFQKDLWSVDVDRGQIEQVLLNLFVNAWQAMPGGGDLYVETENIYLSDNYDKPYEIIPGAYVRIAVTDTGIGMDKSIQQRIFEPFFSTKGVGRGTGLGLASAYGIIKNHKGIINVYSEKGHGATFKIYLPASDKAVLQEKTLTEELLRGTETILLVDDEEMVVDIGSEILQKLGYTVISATSGTQALGLLKQHLNRIDLVILDMIMPDMSGSETYDKLKTVRPNVKVLLSSGYNIDGRASEILERGCNGFIQKPFNLRQISQKIREVIDAV